MEVDVFPGGKAIQDRKRRGRIGCKIAMYLSQNVSDGGGIRTRKVKVNERSIKQLTTVGRGIV